MLTKCAVYNAAVLFKFTYMIKHDNRKGIKIISYEENLNILWDGDKCGALMSLLKQTG
jgi:hypothetical protein